MIATVDADGVALAAIQGLYQLVQEKEQQIERQSKLLAEQSEALKQLAKEVQALKPQRTWPKRNRGRSAR